MRPMDEKLNPMSSDGPDDGRDSRDSKASADNADNAGFDGFDGFDAVETLRDRAKDPTKPENPRPWVSLSSHRSSSYLPRRRRSLRNWSSRTSVTHRADGTS